jgi:drug/metabolite transporter (DMT)-like permease
VSLAVAIPLGVASAAVYGTSIVVQHRASHTGGDEDARHLMRLLRNPTWLVAIAGDFVGFLLNIAALSAGPVVVIQPLVVLMLPIALVVGWRFGGPRPRIGEGLGSAGIIVGLGCFLALAGQPSEGHTPQARYMALAVVIVLVAGIVLSLSVLKLGATLRGSAYGAAAGIYFGTLGVMVDGASNVVVRGGVSGLFTTWRGIVPLIAIVALGTGGIILTQVSFQIGHLAATLPANLAADPVTAVLIGVLLLREHVPLAPWHLCGYLACLVLVIAGTMRLARRAEEGSAAVDSAARMGR